MIKLKLLGGATIESEQGPIAQRAVQRRRIALLALLACARKPVSREKVTAYLWPESDSEQSRHLLSVAVYELRKAIHDGAIITTRDEVSLNTQYITSDVAEFDSALSAGDHQRALALYDGPFMDGFHINDAPDFERWADAERDRLARAYAAALESVAQDHTANGDPAAAVAALRKLSSHDPYSGRVASLLMLALEASGDRAAALQHARAHAALLKQEFGADADPEVEALAARLRHEPREAGSAPAPTEVTRHQRADHHAPLRKRSVIFAAAVTAIVTVFALVAIVVWRTRSVPEAEAGSSSMQSIAVLPFRNLSPSEANTFFSDGLSDEIINALSSVPSLNVAGRTSTFSFRGDSVDLREVGKRLNVDHVLEGTVRMDGKRVRVTSQLINATSGFEVWSANYDQPLAMQDLISIQEEIAQAVVTALQAKLAGPQTRTPLVAQQTNDVEAFQLFVTGRGHLHRRTVADMRKALSYFEQAIARDSGYALAYAGKAEVLALLGAYDYGALRPADAYPAARAAAQRALELDPQLAEAHTALAAVLFNFDRNWDAAEKEFVRALQLNHGYSAAHHWYALMLNAQNRRPEAFKNIMRARELDPLSSVIATGLARHYYYARDFRRAVQEYQKVLAGDSTFVTAHIGLGITFAASGQYEAASRELDAAARFLGMMPPIIHALQAYTYGLAGNKPQAQQHRSALMAMASRVYVPSEIVAMAHIGLGDHAAAFASFEQAAVNRSGGVNYLQVEPLVDPLRSDRRFKALLDHVSAKKP